MEQRVSVQLKCPNPLYEKWLCEMYEDAVSKGSRSRHALELALDSLRKYPLVLETPQQCLILKGFGKNICNILSRRTGELHPSLPVSITGIQIQQNTKTKRKATGECNTKDKPTKKSRKEYVPEYRSGPFAILVTLLENQQKNIPYLSKNTLQTEAQLLCDESMTRAKPGSFYTAWSSMASLLNKGLIIKVKKKCMQYSLTESGTLLAEKLAEHSQIKENSDPLPTCSSNIINADPPRVSTPIVVPLVKTSSNHLITDCPVIMASQSSSVSFEAGSFDVILLVDKQETTGKSKKNDATILELEKYKMIKYELRHLKVGDFTWIARNRLTNEELVLDHIVERKRMDDLAHSIKDGRFHEQKFRLKQCGLPNIIYLVESHGSNKHNIGLPLPSLKQAVANTRIQDGFMTHFTSSLGHSIKYLAMMTKILCEKYSDETLHKITKQNGESSEDWTKPSTSHFYEFNSFNSAASKTKTLTVKDLFIKQLLQLKGISVEKAVAITSVYPTPRCLIDAFKGCRDKPDLLLSNIKYGIKMTKIGASISKTLYKFFTDIQLH